MTSTFKLTKLAKQKLLARCLCMKRESEIKKPSKTMLCFNALQITRYEKTVCIEILNDGEFLAKMDIPTNDCNSILFNLTEGFMRIELNDEN